MAFILLINVYIEAEVTHFFSWSEDAGIVKSTTRYNNSLWKHFADLELHLHLCLVACEGAVSSF